MSPVSFDVDLVLVRFVHALALSLSLQPMNFHNSEVSVSQSYLDLGPL